MLSGGKKFTLSLKLYIPLFLKPTMKVKDNVLSEINHAICVHVKYTFASNMGGMTKKNKHNIILLLEATALYLLFYAPVFSSNQIHKS